MQKGTGAEQGFNRQLASRLRPGASIEDAKAVWGSRWEPPSRKNEGYVGLRDKLGFHLRLDREMRVGSVSFSGNFPPKYLVEGLLLGMALDAALVARPGLAQPRKPDPDDAARNLVRYRETLPGGCELQAVLQGGKLVAITIEHPGSQYPKADEFVVAPEGRYRIAAGTPGSPFADPNVKMYVVGALMEKHLIDLGESQELAMHVRGRFVDFDKVGYKLLKDVRDFIAKYPLTTDELSSVERLYFDRTVDIIGFVWPHFDGETAELDVTSLEGLEHCPNLREVAISTQLPLDLTPLRKLQKLESLEISENGIVENAATLLEIASLRKLRVRGRTDLDAAQRAVLAARGVAFE
jgi:hypothetical protein